MSKVCQSGCNLVRTLIGTRWSFFSEPAYNSLYLEQPKIDFVGMIRSCRPLTQLREPSRESHVLQRSLAYESLKRPTINQTALLSVAADRRFVPVLSITVLSVRVLPVTWLSRTFPFSLFAANPLDPRHLIHTRSSKTAASESMIMRRYIEDHLVELGMRYQFALAPEGAEESSIR